MIRAFLRFAGMVVGLVILYIICTTFLSHLYKIWSRRVKGKISTFDEQWDFGELLFGLFSIGLILFLIIGSITGNYLENPTLIISILYYIANTILFAVVFPILYLIPISFMLLLVLPEG